MSNRERWTQGVRIGFRLILFGVFLSVVTLPLRLVEHIPSEHVGIRILASILYMVGVLPFFLPAVLRASGFEMRFGDDIGEFGDRTRSIRKKQQELDQERIAKRTAVKLD